MFFSLLKYTFIYVVNLRAAMRSFNAACSSIVYAILHMAFKLNCLIVLIMKYKRKSHIETVYDVRCDIKQV